ncbi:MAG: FecR domain-containing protein [Bacteroidota bacterium]
MNPDKYQSFSYSDFAADEIFIEWVLNPEVEVENFWKTFIQQHPEKLAEIESARKIILTSRELISLPKFDSEEKDKLNENILSAIATEQRPLREMKRRTPAWMKWAAVILLLSSIGSILYFSQNQIAKTSYITSYGEIKSFKLPDGSMVKLHANSQLTFDKEWKEGADREVRLKGEAYFEVEKKLKTNAKFSVLTEDLKVEVLGTEFNVDTREEKTEVVLNEGSIRLKLEDDEKQSILMEPGDLVTFSQKHKELNQRKVDAGIRISWKEGIQHFDKAPLAEVINQIEEIYGIKIDIQDQELLKRNLTIGIPVENLEIALATLESILGKGIAPTTENQFRIK